jgi:hypothetical protein
MQKANSDSSTTLRSVTSTTTLLALPLTSMRLVPDLMEHPDENHLYLTLKETFLSSYKLTNFARIEQPMKLAPLGGKKPTELLAEMMEMCPRVHEY